MQNKISRTKDLSIETLRGIAIIMMVAGHVIGTNSEEGLRVCNDSGWRYFYRSFEYLRMPLFTVISGFVYSLRPVESGNMLNFLKGKTRRILLPMITVGTLHFILQQIVPGTNSKSEIANMWKIYLFPYEHFWFLQSIFLIFIFIAIIDHFQLISTEKKWLIVFIVTAIGRSFLPPLGYNYFSYEGFLNLLPFFVLGCGIERYRNTFTNKSIIRGLLILFIVVITVHQYLLVNRTEINFLENTLLSLMAASSGIVLLFYIRRNISVLSKLGHFAYGIYLFHVFGTAGSRIMLMNLNIINTTVLFVIGLLAGLGVPILIELLLERSKVLRMAFLGLQMKTVIYQRK